MTYPTENNDNYTHEETLNKEYGFVTVAGEDRLSFLQAVCSADISPLEGEMVVFSSLLSPQGRIVASFLIIPINLGLWLLVDKGLVAILHNNLEKLAIGKKVAIGKNLNMNTYFSKANLKCLEQPSKVCRDGNVVFFADPRHPKLKIRAITPHQQNSLPEFLSDKNKMEYSSYLWNSYSIGLVENGESLLEKPLFPVEACHIQWSAINFEKGCFPGQEVNIRMLHRKRIKKVVCGAYSQDKIINPIPNSYTLEHDLLKFTVIKSVLKDHLWAGLLMVKTLKGSILEHNFPKQLNINGNNINLRMKL